MTFSIKVAAMLGLSAGIATAAIEAVVAGGSTGQLLRDGALTGAIALGGALAVHKYKVDEITRKIDLKADKSDMDSALARVERRMERIENGVDSIRDHLMGS